MSRSDKGVLLAGLLIGLAFAKGDKPQGVRLIDVLALGPLMVVFGTKEKLGTFERKVLQFAGAATIGYNGRNLLERAKREVLKAPS